MAALARYGSEWGLESPLHNKIAPVDRPIHAWYRFVLSFPPHLVREYLDKFEVPQGGVVLDPFSGTGTTAAEAILTGRNAIGVEANSMAFLASSVKTNLKLDVRELGASLRRLESHPLTLEAGAAAKSSILAERVSLFGLRALSEEEEAILIKGSISPLPLHRVLCLRAAIQSEVNPEIRNLFRLALAWTLVNGVGNVRFGPEVGITKPKADADVVGLFDGQARRMLHDLEDIGNRQIGNARIFQSDSRADYRFIEPESVDCVFTSPPYPNEKDYTRTTRLESVLLGLLTSKAELRALKKGLLRSNTRTVYVADEEHQEVADIQSIQEVAAEIERKRLELGKTSGFEKLYGRVTRLYFGGMRQHLRELKPILKPGARLGYVVGDQASFFRVMIRTGHLLADVARAEGYEVESIDVFRKRFATASQEYLNEEVVCLRWKG